MSGTAVVVGAGPAGCLVATGLAARGWKVNVYERRPLPRPEDSKGPRGYPMQLTGRSIQAIQAAGMDLNLVGDAAVLCEGMYLNGKLLRLTGGDKSHLVDRHQLGREMYLAAVAKQYSKGGSIAWFWEHSLDSVDFNDRVVYFVPATDSNSNSTEARVPVKYDLLVGTDGYNSGVRAALMAAYPKKVKTKHLYSASLTYKTFHNMNAEDITPVIPDMLTQKPRQYYNSLRVPGQAGLGFWKASDGSLSGIMSGAKSYDAAAVREVLQKRLPGCKPEFIESIVDKIKDEAGQTPSRFGKLIKVSQFHGPHTVLLGDAAHPMTSTLGQGCNMALESVRVFLDTLDRVGTEKAPAAFTQARRPDVHAMQTIEFLSVIRSAAAFNEPQLICGAMRLPTFFEKLSSKVLMTWAPEWCGKIPKISRRLARPQYLVMNNPAKRYSEVLGYMQAQAGFLAALGVGVLAIGTRVINTAAQAVLR